MNKSGMNRRELLQNISIGAVSLTALPLLACNGKSDDTGGAAVNDEWEAMAESLEAGGILTPADPGEWAGKEDSHTPAASASGTTVTVVTEHGMEADHWIDHVYLRDQDGVVVGLEMLAADAGDATVAFVVPEGTTSVTPYSSCNLHGLWMGDAVSIG